MKKVTVLNENRAIKFLLKLHLQKKRRAKFLFSEAFSQSLVIFLNRKLSLPALKKKKISVKDRLQEQLQKYISQRHPQNQVNYQNSKPSFVAKKMPWAFPKDY